MEISRSLPSDLQFQISTALNSANQGTQQLIRSGGVGSVENALELFSTKDPSYNLNFDAKQLPAIQQPGAYSGPASANLSPDVAKLVRDPNFQISNALLDCANNFFGRAGITETLTGSNGLLNDLIGGWNSGNTPHVSDPILFPTDPLRADLKFDSAEPILFPNDPIRADLKFNDADPILFPTDPTREDLRFDDPSAFSFGGIDQTIQQLRSEGTVADPILYPVDPLVSNDTSKTEPPQNFYVFTGQLHSLQEMEASVKDLASLAFQVNRYTL